MIFTSCKLPPVTLILKVVAFAQSLYVGMPGTWVGSVAGWVMLPTSQKIPAFLFLASCPKARLTDVVGQGRKRKAGILSADFILQDKREKIGRQVSFYYVILPLPNQCFNLKYQNG